MITIADRTVKVDLIANVSGYVAGMKQAAAYSTYVGSEASIAARKLAAQRQVFDQTGRAAIAVGVLAVAGIALAVSKFAEFDQAISNVNAVMQETPEKMERLRDAALEAGGRTIYTATEAAHAIEELGKAGISTAQILDGALDGALDLAASGQLEVARAAEITAVTLKQFGLGGRDAAHVADVLSAGAGKALGSVEDLAQGLKFVGPVAASMGVSLEETIGVLALFADQGLIGEQAGTSLRGVLSSLTSPSKEAANEIENLGINLYDANGSFVGLANVADQLSGAYSDLDDKSRDASLGVIFGNQQVTAARVLFDQGGGAVRRYTAEVTDSGYAARVAADRLDNLKGDLEKLGGAFDTVLIKQGSAANDTLRGLVQGLTFLVDAAADLPPVAVNIGAVAAVVALAGGAALLGVGKFTAFKVALVQSGVSARGTAVAVGGVTAAITVATLIVGAFVEQAATAAANTEAFSDSLDDASGAATAYTRDLVIKRLEEQNAFETADKLGISQQELTDALLEGGSAWNDITRRIGEYDQMQNPLTSGIRNQENNLKDVRSELEGGIEAWKNQTAANEDAARAADADAEALAVLEGQAGDTAGAIDDLSNQILNFGKATLDTREANRQFESALDDLTDAIANNGATLDINTREGNANEAALDDLAEASKKRASAILLETGSQEDATAALADGRQKLIDMLGQFGITGQAAEDYADKLGLIPENITTAATITGVDEAEAKLAGLFRYSGRQIEIKLNSGGGFASGGYTGNMPVGAVAGVVHGREFVTDAAATSIPANRAALEYMNAGGNISVWSGGYSAPASIAGTPTGAGAPIQIIVQSKGGIDLLKYVDLKIADYDYSQDSQIVGGIR